jgi:hypothetical protein
MQTARTKGLYFATIAPIAEPVLAACCAAMWQASVSMQVSCAMHRIGVNSKGCAVTYFEESPALRYQKKGWQ